MDSKTPLLISVIMTNTMELCQGFTNSLLHCVTLMKSNEWTTKCIQLALTEKQSESNRQTYKS